MNAPLDKQNQDSPSQIVKLSQQGDLRWVFENNPIRYYATELWHTLSERDTAVTYKQFLLKTLKLLIQAIALIFFLLLLLVAIIIWLWGIGFQSGQYFGEWLESKTSIQEALYDLLKLILWPFKLAFEWAKDRVKKYLGWEITFDKCETSDIQ